MARHSESLTYFTDGLTQGNMVVLSQAITLVESSRPQDQALAQQLLNDIMPKSGTAYRVGITGVPGVGKSTFIEAFGQRVLARGKRLAVLAIDPSSAKTKGSILGDKTRMEQLARAPGVFIRPSPAAHFLGGVAGATREAMLLCEAAGFEVIFIETVGVGQSETAVRGMVDFFLLLLLAGAGDELQAIKKGVIEMADALVITKADGDNQAKASQAKADLMQARQLLEAPGWGWSVPVLTCSAQENINLDEIWSVLQAHEKLSRESGWFMRNRQQQNLQWMNEAFQALVQQHLAHLPAFRQANEELRGQVQTGMLSPVSAALKLWHVFQQAAQS